jgi:hypothetical protein
MQRAWLQSMVTCHRPGRRSRDRLPAQRAVQLQGTRCRRCLGLPMVLVLPIGAGAGRSATAFQARPVAASWCSTYRSCPARGRCDRGSWSHHASVTAGIVVDSHPRLFEGGARRLLGNRPTVAIIGRRLEGTGFVGRTRACRACYRRWSCASTRARYLSVKVRPPSRLMIWPARFRALNHRSM